MIVIDIGVVRFLHRAPFLVIPAEPDDIAQGVTLIGHAQPHGVCECVALQGTILLIGVVIDKGLLTCIALHFLCDAPLLIIHIFTVIARPCRLID